MRRTWRLALMFPIVLALAACLDPVGTTMPKDDENDDSKKPNETGAIPVYVGDFA